MPPSNPRPGFDSAPGSRPDRASAHGHAQQRAIGRSALALGLYAGALGVSFGAVSTTSGLTIGQTMVLSLVMFSGGSQFAFVGVAALGAPWAAIPTALLLAVRNAFYGIRLSSILGRLGWRRPLVAHLVIDETTAMAVAQPTPRLQRYAFYATGLVLGVLWQIGSLVGALVGQGIDTQAFGLDVAAPAAFLALLWPALRGWRAQAVAVGSAALAFLLIPVAPAGIPVIATVAVAVAAGVSEKRRPATADETNPAAPDGEETPS